MSYPLYPADPTRDPAEPFRNLDPAPSTSPTAVIEPQPGAWDEFAGSNPTTADELIARQRAAFGGPKVGSAFFGWLITAATWVILTGLVSVAGALLGLGVIPDPWAAGGIGPVDASTLAWIIAGTLLGIVLVAFYCGGYVAGRMARFSGVAQGLTVWAWAIVSAIAVTVLTWLLNGRLDIVAIGAEMLPRIPMSEGALTTAGIVSAVAVVVAALGGALLGGVVGVRYHRRIDRVGVVE